MLSRRTLLAAALVMCACERAPKEPPSKPAVLREPVVREPTVSEPQRVEVPPGPSCEERIAAVKAQPGLPGTPQLDAARPELFANVKAEPVLFVRPPARDAEMAPAAKAHAGLIDRTSHPWGVVQRAMSTLGSTPELARQALLREGYVFAEAPRLALSLYAHLSAPQLFSEPRIWVQRGERTRWATREDDRYVWEDGEERGRPVRLLVFDRVGTEEPTPPVHRDLRSLRMRLHFDRFKPLHLTEQNIVADLRYGGHWVPTLLRSEGPRLELECEIVPERAAAELGVIRERGARRERALFGLRQAMVAQIHEGLRFDEPKTEIGQQDGHLRFEWEAAYLAGRRHFKFNDDKYWVFGASGHPAPPQVCVDFLVDTLERASGTWWRAKGEEPGRVVGRLAFERAERRELRSTRRFIEYAREKGDWFEVRDPPPKERVEIGKLPRLTRVLAERADHYQPGDMVIINGYTPWDEEERHYHSFFIYESDPMSGFPLTIVGNAGRPAMRVLRTEANRTPKRNIVSRIRPRLEWLESLVTLPPAGEALTPAPLLAETSGV